MDTNSELGNVILINLPIRNYETEDMEEEIGFNPSIGLLSLSTWLELNGYTPIPIDLCYDKMKIAELIDKVGVISPILVGLSVYTININIALVLAKAIKARYPNIPILMGGPHPTLALHEVISSEYVDFVIRKEGESPLLELLEAITSNETKIKFKDIPGLVFKTNESINKNVLRQPIKDLDLMPIIKREFYNLHKYINSINICTSRGCPGNCIYCAGTALSGVDYRIRDIGNVFLEVVYLSTLLKEKIGKVFIVDDTFTAIPDRVNKFVWLLKKYNVNLTWRFQSRVDVISEDLLDKVASIGCTQILYGIESGSQLVLDGIRKNINLDIAKRVISLTFSKKILPELSFIIGHYCDTKETMEKTFHFIEEMSKKYNTEINLFYNIPFPGTWQYINREKIGLNIKTSNYDYFNGLTPIVETSNFSINDQKLIFNKARKHLWRISSAKILKNK